jgi:hypothetical protein
MWEHIEEDRFELMLEPDVVAMGLAPNERV